MQEFEYRRKTQEVTAVYDEYYKMYLDSLFDVDKLFGKSKRKPNRGTKEAGQKMKILKTGPYSMRKVKVKEDLFDALELSIISECDSDMPDKEQTEFESLPQDAKQDYVKI